MPQLDRGADAHKQRARVDHDEQRRDHRDRFKKTDGFPRPCHTVEKRREAQQRTRRE